MAFYKIVFNTGDRDLHYLDCYDGFIMCMHMSKLTKLGPLCAAYSIDHTSIKVSFFKKKIPDTFLSFSTKVSLQNKSSKTIRGLGTGSIRC